MADTTRIAWTDHTFNPWWGCQRVSAGCDHCYAAALDASMGGKHWAPGATYKTMSNDYWKKPFTWNRKAEKAGAPSKVLCGSMCDWADKRGPAFERNRLWRVVYETRWLRWQLLTKRAASIASYLPDNWDYRGKVYPHVWLGVTVENTKSLRRIRHLVNIPAQVRFLSIEPLLEDLGELDLTGIDWVILGGESGRHRRMMAKRWAENVITQCREQGVAVFFKQWGGSGPEKGGCLWNGKELKEFPE